MSHNRALRTVLHAFGIPPGSHFPTDGLPSRTINGLTYYIAGIDPILGNRNRRHRVIVICPICAKHLSAGRLLQHLPVHTSQEILHAAVESLE